MQATEEEFFENLPELEATIIEKTDNIMGLINR